MSFNGSALQRNVDYPVKLEDKAKASNETQQRANASKSDGMDRPGADALGGLFSKVRMSGSYLWSPAAYVTRTLVQRGLACAQHRLS